MKLIATIILILSFSQAYAVDGYKSLKFGMSKSEVIKSGFCTFGKEQSSDTQKYLKTLSCTDFKFKGSNTKATAYLMDNKFLRVVITIDTNDLNVLMGMLTKKYGIRSSPVDSIDAVKELSKPDNSIWIGFDKDTVLILLTTNKFLKLSAYLVYNSPEYSKVLTKYKTDAIGDDI